MPDFLDDDDDDPQRKRNPTLHYIAALLGGEGYNDHSEQEIKRYWNNRHVNPRALARLRSIRKAFSEMVEAKLSAGDRLIMGRYIAVLCKAQFDTGLRIGLMSLACEWKEDAKDDAVLEALQETKRGA